MAAGSEYVIDDAGWDTATQLAAVRQALDVVKPLVTLAETDIPWHKRDQWPSEVVAAALLLRARCVSGERDQDYLQTGVQPVDHDTREAFTTFAPYAYDCTLWGAEGELASLSDEGTAIIVSLTAMQAEQLRASLGTERLFSLAEWRERHPSPLARLRRRLKRG